MMNFFSSVFNFLIFSVMVSGHGESADENSPKLVYHKSGNISLTGIFSGRNCDLVVDKFLEEMASAIWTIEVLNSQQFLNGITIGLSLFETCSGQNLTFELSEEDSLNTDDSLNVGILMAPELYEKVLPRPPPPLHLSGKVVTVQHLMNIHILADLVVQLLTNLQWMNVNLFVTDSESVLNTFSEKTSAEGICVHDELLISDSNTSLHINNSIKPAHSYVIVIIAAFGQIVTLMDYEKWENESIKLILLPSDFVFQPLSGLPKHSVVLLPSMKDKKVLLEFINNDAHQRNFLNHKEPTKSPLFIGVAATILKMLMPLRKMQDDRCKDLDYGSRQSCVQIANVMTDLRENKTVLQHPDPFEISPDDVANTVQVLKIDLSPNDEMFLYIASLTDTDSAEDVAVFQIFNLKTRNPQPILLMINDELLSDPKATVGGEAIGDKKQAFELDLEKTEDLSERQKTESETLLIKLQQGLKGRSIGNNEEVTGGQYDKTNSVNYVGNFSKRDPNYNSHDLCRNFQRNFTQLTRKHNATDESSALVWRFHTWVTINTSVGLVGILCTLSIMFFIVSRFCKDDILEGSPYFTLVLMFSVVIMFVLSFPFHVELPSNEDSLSSLICIFRMRGPPLVYAIPFSLLLSRSLMLASSESQTHFVSHINGYIQTTLCFFMFGVQVSLTSQQWAHETIENSFNCSWSNATNKFMFGLGYDILLLAMLTCASPFIIRSKRNYKEGLFFSISVFLIVVVWSTWIGFYFLLPQEEKDAAVAIGLTSTATVLLLFIFIPRTYLMVATIIRDRAARSLPSLDRNVLPDVSDPNYVSQQSLNDLVFGTITYKSSEMGLSNPNFYTDGTHNSTQENCHRESALD